jgi:beta-glucosidase
MSVEEKLAQLQGLWLLAGTGSGVVAPTMDSRSASSVPFEEFAAHGLGQITRLFGTAPRTPAEGLTDALEKQRWLARNTRTRIGALLHEECLTGLNAWTATTFPTPLAWGATFDPETVAEMARGTGQTMRSLGIHQGLAPVLDLVTDHRWGRVEECIGEDPYLVGLIANAYVTGLQEAGVIATLKHFAGYSNSHGGRNLSPVTAGPREVEDTFLVPFEIAILDGGAQSVMHSYTDIDGMPVAANRDLLTSVLRDRWGFAGTVVSDYFGVAFLKELHMVAEDLGSAAVQALSAGVDVELPTGDAYREPLKQAVQDNEDLGPLVDLALSRVLTQKEQLGLLDIDQEIARLEKALEDAPERLDPPALRATALRLAEESVILLDNRSGLLPLEPREGLRIGVVGPNADRSAALFGCYSFVNHVLAHHPDAALGIAAPTLAEAVAGRYQKWGAIVEHVRGCPVTGGDPAGFEEAITLARSVDVVVAVMGDQAGLFGNGTSGEGCDAESLSLPGLQEPFLDRLFATGTPVILVLITGRPYAVGHLASQAAATVQAFFPGEEGANAIAAVLAGDVPPQGRLPVSVPSSSGVEPYSYLHAKLAGPSDVTSVNPAPAFAFGHGLSYTSFEYSGVRASERAPTDGWIEVGVDLRNIGSRRGVEVVQLYGRDVVASVARPVAQLLGFGRVDLAPGESASVSFRVPTARMAFHDRAMRRVVEPGEIQVWFGRSCDEPATERESVRLEGAPCAVEVSSPRLTEIAIKKAAGPVVVAREPAPLSL